MKAKLWPIVGVLAVAAMWAASAYANYLAGLALTDDAKMQQVLGAASIACDVLKGVALFMVIALAARGRWFAVGVASLIFCLCTIWSLRSAAYFTADAMSTKITRIEQSNKIADAKMKVIDLKSDRAKFLSGQSVEVSVDNKYARKDALTANKETSQEFRALVGEVESGVKELEDKGFIQATVDPIASATNSDPKMVILVSSLFFAVLLEMCSSWGFWLIARAREDNPGTPILEAMAKLPEASPPPPAQRMALGFGGSLVPVEEPQEITLQDMPVPVAPVQEIAVPLTKPKAFKDPSVGNLDEERIIRALQQVLVHEPSDRVLLATVGLKVNALLPPKHQMPNRISISNTLTPLVAKAIPGAAKERIAGQMWIANVRLRTASESETLVRSKA